MSDSHLPTEVELVYEVMPCNAMRTAQEPKGTPHACAYFRKWGTYHSYDYVLNAPPPQPGIQQPMQYVGRAPLVPELLSGCRKAPILAIGINPNLPGWWAGRRGSLNPLFDDYKQYAHYFRYRAIAKLELSPQDYAGFGGGAQDTPFSDFALEVPPDAAGHRLIHARLQNQEMYEAYQELLDLLAQEMGWQGHRLAVGEDLAYGNMVACPSAKWTTAPAPNDPTLPPMTPRERDGIVSECFHKRKYFARQLFQSLPAVLLVFSQSTANALLAEFADRLRGDPVAPGDAMTDLMAKRVYLHYGTLPDGTALQARLLFAPHITGNPAAYGPARARVVAQLKEEATANPPRLVYRPETGHLARPRGACVFCTMLQIGQCDYEGELTPLTAPPGLFGENESPRLTADSPANALLQEKAAHQKLLNQAFPMPAPLSAWETNDTDEPPLA